MKKSIKKNYVYNLIYQILSLITPLVTAPYISRVLGAESIGIFSYSSSIVSYFVLFASLGISSFGQREISYYQDDREKRTEVFWNVEILSIITTCLSLLFYGLFCFFQKQNKLLYIILSFSILDVSLNINWFFSGLEEFILIVLRNIIVKVLSIIAIFMFVHNPNDLWIYALCNMTSFFISSISLFPILPKFIDKPNLKKINPFYKINEVFTLFIPSIAVSIYTVLDKTMIGLITKDVSENGFYEQAMKLSKMILTLITSLGNVMMPRIGYCFEKKENAIIQDYMYKSYRFVAFLGIPMCFGVISISSNFVPWFFGVGFEKVIPLLNILSFLLIVIGFSNVTGVQYLIPTKRQNFLTKTVVIGACINFIMNIILIPKYGSIGAAISSVIAETVITTTQLWIVRKEISILVILKNSINYFISGLVMFVLIYFESKVFASSLASSLILIFSGCTIYILTLIIIHDDFFIEKLQTLIFKMRINK